MNETGDGYEPCAECGLDAGAVDRAALAGELVALGRRYRAPFTRFLEGEDGDALVRARPEPEVWSALEYACHVRDVLAVQRERILLAQAEDTPTFVPMGRDQRVVDDRYNEQDPGAVVDALAGLAEALAATLTTLDEAGWERTGIYNYPSTAERTMGWVARQTLHEGRHHLLDIGRSLRAARGR